MNREISLAYKAVKGPEDEYTSRITYVISEDGNILDVLNHHIEPTFGKFKLLKEKNEDNI